MELHSAYVLHSRPWRDSSVLVDFWLQHGGRIRAVAKGQRRQTRRAAGNICQPFRPLCVALRGNSDLKTVTHLEADGAACHLPGNRLYAGFYANEILLRALPEADPQPLLYDAYRHLLQDLLDPAIAIEPPLRRFELTLLDELGYGIDFYHDAHSGESIRDGVNYTFVTEAGFIACSGSQIREQGNIYDGARLLQLGQGDLQSDASRVAAKHIMRQAMRPLLGDKPLQSRRLYRPADADKDSD